MSMSASRRRGPVWYQPITRSRAGGQDMREGRWAAARRRSVRGMHAPVRRASKYLPSFPAPLGDAAICPAVAASALLPACMHPPSPPLLCLPANCRGPCFPPSLPRCPLTVDLLEHAEHVLQVAVVQEPDAGVLLILLKRHCRQAGQGRGDQQGPGVSRGGRSGAEAGGGGGETRGQGCEWLAPASSRSCSSRGAQPGTTRVVSQLGIWREKPKAALPPLPPARRPTCKRVGGVDPALVAFAQDDTHAALLRVLGRPVVVVHHAEQHQGVDHHLLGLLLGRRHGRCGLHGFQTRCCRSRDLQADRGGRWGRAEERADQTEMRDRACGRAGEGTDGH